MNKINFINTVRLLGSLIKGTQFENVTYVVGGAVRDLYLGNEIKDIEGVNDINDLHVWSLDGISNVSSMKISVSSENNLENLNHIKSEINHVAKEYDIVDSTVEFII